MSMDIYKEVLKTIEINNCVCPKSDRWSELYKMLPEPEEGSLKRMPALPLILDGWYYSSDKDKSKRLRQHVMWARDNGVLINLHAFLTALDENEWHHLDEV